MNEHPDRGRQPGQLQMSTFKTRVEGVVPVPSGSRSYVREMERPRTESYGELWRRASNRLGR